MRDLVYLSYLYMYVIGRYFQKQLLDEEFLEKNKETIGILNQHGYKIFAIIVIILVSYYTFVVWNKISSNPKPI